MSPYLILAALAAVIGSGYGGFWLGVDHEVAARTREDQHVAKAVEAANGAAAEAIAKIKVVNSKITNEVRHEISERVVYRDCQHSDGGLRLVNQALRSTGAEPAGGGKLPGVDAAE